MSIEEGNSFRHLTVNTPSYRLQVMNKTLAERLAYAMNERGISQGALAKASGIAQPTIWRLVNGKAKGSTRLVDIANALSVRVEWLDNGQGPMDQDDQTYPHQPAQEMKPGGVFSVPLYDSKDNPTDSVIYVPREVESRHCRGYILERNSGCYEAPAGTIIVVDSSEKPGSDDLVYAQVNGTRSVYRFIDGGANGYLSIDDERIPLIPVSDSVTISGVVVFLLRDLKRRK